MRRKYQREPIGTEWTVGAVANTGDGIVAAEKLGAALELMEDAWWGPTVPLEGAPWFALSERNSPGSMIVNMSGKRFMNESMPYVEACHQMYGGEYGQGAGPGENVPAWLIFDQQYRDRYIFAGLQPGQRIPEEVAGVRRDREGRHHRRTRTEDRPVRRGAAIDRRPVQRFRPRPESTRTSTAVRVPMTATTAIPTNKPNPNLGEITPPALLRGQDGSRRPGHQGRHPHRRARPGTARRRLGDRRACTRPATSAHR